MSEKEEVSKESLKLLSKELEILRETIAGSLRTIASSSKESATQLKIIAEKFTPQLRIFIQGD